MHLQNRIVAVVLSASLTGPRLRVAVNSNPGEALPSLYHRCALVAYSS